ncbi:MAG: adenylate/guanylate cyclase domain-containing protein [Treponema sp.]|jgi:class 3 adenylate cyclase|nr:adenylate/guanylate cyclase domain-containing protein [Treponema sp.]
MVTYVNKKKAAGEKYPRLILIACIFSLCVVLAAAGKLLYDKTLEGAEAENASSNRQAAAALDIFFSSMRSASITLLETVDAAAINSGGGYTAQAAGNLPFLFFANNPNIAALVFYDAPLKNNSSLTFINENFFRSGGLNPRLVDIFTELHMDALDAAARNKESVLNCESIFGTQTLAMFFPYRSGAAVIFFQPAKLDEIFKTGARVTCCINTAGDILIDSGRTLLRGGVNISTLHFVRNLLADRSNTGNERYVLEDGRRTLGAYSKLTAAPAVLISEISYDSALADFVFAAKRSAAIAVCALFFLAVIILSSTKSIGESLKRLKLFDETNHKLEIVSRFADMPLAQQSLSGDLPVEAEYKKVSILLPEIESFNYFTERLNPKDAVELLNSFNVCVDAGVKKTSGCLELFSSGLVMAHWGALATSGSAEHDALNCARCALMMRVSMYELNKKRTAAGMDSVRFLCGISSGEFIAGIADCGERSFHTLMGEETINADIAKAQNAAFDTDILLTEGAWRLIHKYVIVQEMQPLLIEGRVKPLRLFALINLRTKQGEIQVFPATIEDVRALYGLKPPSLQPEEDNAPPADDKAAGVDDELEEL